MVEPVKDEVVSVDETKSPTSHAPTVLRPIPDAPDLVFCPLGVRILSRVAFEILTV